MDSSPRQRREADLRRRLTELAAEVLKTEEELVALASDAQLKLGAPNSAATRQTPRTPAEKIALFLDLFGTRQSVYPRRWDNPGSGKSGYSPACDNDRFGPPAAGRQSGVCKKPDIKCTECLHQRFPPLDERAVEAHLRGAHTLGVYAIGTDDTCRFIAADFAPPKGLLWQYSGKVVQRSVLSSSRNFRFAAN